MNESMILLAASTFVWSTLFIQGVCFLNRMSCRTPLAQRLGYVLFTVGVFALLTGPYFGTHTASWAEVCAGAGSVLFRSQRTILDIKRRIVKAVEQIQERYSGPYA